jgi:hypothetical protein
MHYHSRKTGARLSRDGRRLTTQLAAREYPVDRHWAFSDADRDLTSVAAWESSNPKVATVSTTGLLTAIADGETTITGACQGTAGSKPLAFVHPSPWDC